LYGNTPQLTCTLRTFAGADCVPRRTEFFSAKFLAIVDLRATA
jgi:hypothetical protein